MTNSADWLARAIDSSSDGRWNIGIEYFHRAIASQQQLSAFHYHKYALCFEKLGNGREALSILAEGRRNYPNSKKLIEHTRSLHTKFGQWQDALEEAHRLVELNAKNPSYHFSLGQIHAYLLDERSAQTEFRTGLELSHGGKMSDIVHNVEARLQHSLQSGRAGRMTSRYIGTTGKNNLGVIVHRQGTSKYITKISRASSINQREHKFYSRILPDSQELAALAPRYVSFFQQDDINYLTLEFINEADRKPQLSEALSLTGWIQQGAPDNVSDELISELDTSYITPRALRSGRSFASIHLPGHNALIFELLHDFAQENLESRCLLPIVHQLEKLVMNKRLYLALKPEIHYGMMHSDFTVDNIMGNKADGSFKIIDWQSYKYGPKFFDILRFVTHLELPYADVRREVLAKEKRFSEIELFFFLYGYIITNLLTDFGEPLSFRIASKVRPAMEDIRILASHINI